MQMLNIFKGLVFFCILIGIFLIYFAFNTGQRVNFEAKADFQGNLDDFLITEGLGDGCERL